MPVDNGCRFLEETQIRVVTTEVIGDFTYLDYFDSDTPWSTELPIPTATPNPTVTPTPTPEPGGSARIYVTSSEADLTSLDGGANENDDEAKIVSEKAWVVGEITLNKKSKLMSGQTALKIKIEDQWEKTDSDDAEAVTDEAESVKNRAFLNLPLANTDTDKFVVQWRKATLKDGALGEWSDGSPLDGNDTDDTVIYRAWIDFKPDVPKKFEGAIGGWDTTVGIADLDPITGAPMGGEDAKTRTRFSVPTAFTKSLLKKLKVATTKCC